VLGLQDWEDQVKSRSSSADLLKRSANLFVRYRAPWLLLCAVGFAWAGDGQSRNLPATLLTCPECAVSGQTPDLRWPAPALVTFLKDPKPYSVISGLPGPLAEQLDLHYDLIGRIVGTQPLALDVMHIVSAGLLGREDSEITCRTMAFPLVDEKLKGTLSKLKFGEVVKATLMYGGNREFPHELVLSELAPDLRPDEGSGTCFNRSGLLIFYGTALEHVKVFNDGSISYQDRWLNRFERQKLSGGELAILLKAFADQGFNSLPPSPFFLFSPPTLKVEPKRNLLTLLCSRLQTVSLAGLETRLAPLLARLDDLKVRATSQTYYLLKLKDRISYTPKEWPFPQVPLSQLVSQWDRGRGAYNRAAVSEAMRATVPEEFLAGLHRLNGGTPSVYYTEAGKMYWVEKECNTSRCSAFQNLNVLEIPTREALMERTREYPNNALAMVRFTVGAIWPGDTGVRLAQVGPEGIRISNSDFEKNRFLYDQLFEVGSEGGLAVPLIEDGYAYRRVRICRVDPQDKPPPCITPDEKTN
jgi:hypothetical protein